jgi:flagellar P-ring protein FlgI
VLLGVTLLFGLTLTSSMADAQESRSSIRLADICRVKGQEENKLQGLGLVVGLKGTGDSKLSVTTRTVARLVQNMGGSVATDKQGIPNLKELEEAGNVALVMVTATIPAAGAQQGDQLNCTVDAISAKSLVGGRLVLAYMLGPRADVQTIYGIASGPISIADTSVPTSGMVFDGCKMETTITNGFVLNNKMTLILDRDLASFSTAADVQDAINSFFVGTMAGNNYGLAKAKDQLHIEVELPPAYAERPVMFAKLILDIELSNLKKNKRVVINEREGVIVIGENVLINPVAINHKNLTIQAGGNPEPFVAFDPSSPKAAQPALKNLVEALNALKVPTDDVIAIIRTLKRNGDLYGEVVIQ